MILLNGHPSNYNIAIRNDDKLFRIPKGMDYCEKLPENEYCIQYGDRKCQFKTKYFDVFGRLRPKYWGLPRII